MAHLETHAARESRHRERYDRIQLRRALAAADDEETQYGTAPRGPVGRRTEREELGTHRVADHPRGLRRVECVGEGRQHVTCKACEHAIGVPRDRVLLVNDQRPAREPRGDAAGTRHEPAEADDDDRAMAAHRPQRLVQCAHESKRRGEQRAEPLAAQSADRDPFDGQPFGRHEPRLDALSRAVPDDAAAARAELARERERREDVPARAAGHDDHGARHVVTVAGPRVREAASWYTRSRMPIHATVTTRLERP